MEKKNDESTVGAVIKQTTAIALVSLLLVAAVHPLLILIADKTDWFVYDSPLFYILGSLYGWLLGVANFVGMALSLVMMTSSPGGRQEAQKRAQAMYMGRLVVLLLFTVGGCFIPIFRPAAILLSLAATQFGIFIYSLIFKLREANRLSKLEKNPEPEGPETDGDEDASETPDAGEGEEQTDRPEETND